MIHAVAEMTTSLDPPMVIVTTAIDDQLAGCLVGFHSQSSIVPARYSVWLSKANHTYRLALRSTHIAVHMLTEHDQSMARTFGTLSGDTTDKFACCDFEIGAHGLPILTGCPNRFIARRVALLDEGGDHVCVTADIVDGSSSGPFVPLRMSQVGDLVPGHGADERPAPPTERAVF